MAGRLFISTSLRVHGLVTNVYQTRFNLSSVFYFYQRCPSHQFSISVHCYESTKTAIMMPDQPSQGQLSATEILANLNPEMKSKLDELKLEYEFRLHGGRDVPAVMTDVMWLKLLELKTFKQQIKALKKWKIYELTKQEIALEKMERNKVKKELLERNELKLCSFDDRIYIRFSRSSVTYQHDLNMANAMLLNQPILLDFSFEENANTNELRVLQKLLIKTYIRNRELTEPFHLMLCNANIDGYLIKKMSKVCHRSVNQFPFTIKKESYLDLFPRNRLVYLTPDSPNNYRYNPFDVPIIGVCTDYCENKKQTLRKAKREGIRHGKFPLDVYLKWHIGKKSLEIPDVLKIWSVLTDTHGDWVKAFQSTISSQSYSKL